MRLSTRADSGVGGGASCWGVTTGRFSTPWGEGLVTVGRERLVGVELPPVLGSCASDLETLASPEDQRTVQRWVAELEAYFRGERLSWRVDEVGFDAEGMTPFTLSTVEMLLTVPAGSTVSYGELAEMVGCPRAARAVGSVMARNPIPVVVPCHRVIRSDGSLGRYGTDSSWKERLLMHERVNMGGA
jgi:methylated-DNA-[protein]-cysteine S-methyltransferase